MTTFRSEEPDNRHPPSSGEVRGPSADPVRLQVPRGRSSVAAFVMHSGDELTSRSARRGLHLERPADEPRDGQLTQVAPGTCSLRPRDLSLPSPGWRR